MIAALASLKSLIKTKSYHIDHPLFRLHYQATVCALLGFCLILTAKILFGDTIDCKSRILGSENFYDNICFSRGTFTQYAIDTESVRQTAIQSFQKDVASRQAEGSIQLLKITDNLDKRAAEFSSSQSPLPQSSSIPTVVTSTSISTPKREPGFVDGFLGFLYKSIFADDPIDDQQLAAAITMVNVTDPRTNVTNYTFVRDNYFNEALSGTDVGEFIKHQYRVIHRIIKNNNIPFTTNIRYLYSGVMIPREKREIHSMTYFHRYYQYMPIILFLQAVFFYLPHYLWKNWENGIISSVCKQLHDNRLAPTDYIESNYHMIDYLQSCFTLNRSLVYKYYLCHILLLVNLIGQICVLNAVFNDQFVTYGIDVFYHLFIDNDTYGLRGLDDDFADLNSPMDFVFPKVTSCTFRTLSQAGLGEDKNEFLCILPLNILHDKFFLVLWFWFLILGMLTTLQIIFDILYLIIPKLRKFLFRRRFGPYLSPDNRHSSSLPELFLLDLIGTNSDKFAFAALMRKLNKEEDCHHASPSENQSLV